MLEIDRRLAKASAARASGRGTEAPVPSRTLERTSDTSPDNHHARSMPFRLVPIHLVAASRASSRRRPMLREQTAAAQPSDSARIPYTSKVLEL